MRLSIRWIFDHIAQKLDWQSFNIDDLVKLLNKTTSEIEYVEHFKLDLNQFTIVKVIERSNATVRAYSSELKSEISLPDRHDAVVDSYYLVKHLSQEYLSQGHLSREHPAQARLVKNAHSHGYSWATFADFGSEKVQLIPAVQDNNYWKSDFEVEDYILILDNKAISHRPDLWGHRGFAREVAALTGYDLKPLDQLISTRSVEQYPGDINIAHNGPFTIEIKQSKHISSACRRFSGLYISEITNMPSDLSIASRLIRVDAKPIDFLVDLTNYVMFDLGQPIHAYDADKISSKKIVVQSGNGDTLKLLDNSEVVLDARDCSIYDGDQLGISKPIALAGIMGGSSTAVSSATKSVFLESANFDGSSIRHTSMRLKKRTEASARFEKSLDPNQNVDGILRFLNLLEQNNVCYEASEAVTSLGAKVEEKTINVSADLIKKLLSVAIEPAVVTKILTKIGFGVQYDGTSYIITVPPFRGTKDVTIPVDIVEEIGRFIGYEVIDLELPKRVMSAFDFKSVQNVREIKKHLAYGLQMNEVQSYAFFDEEFLRELAYEPGKTVEVINPQSENWRRLVTSLVPNLIKVININKHKQEQFRYFELNRVWSGQARSGLVNDFDVSHGQDTHGDATHGNNNNLNAIEAFELAGIIGDHKKELNFYECKNILNSLFEFLQINIKWRKPELKDLGNKKLEPWYYGYETAELTFDNQVIGLAGMADSRFLSKIMPEGKAFVFELNADFLINSRPEFKKFIPLEKYPEVHLDISILVPGFVSVHDVEKLIKMTKTHGVDAKITKVTLVDFFEKEEWGNKKSLTFRITLYDEHKTLVKTEVDRIYQDIVVAVEKLGGVVR